MKIRNKKIVTFLGIALAPLEAGFLRIFKIFIFLLLMGCAFVVFTNDAQAYANTSTSTSTVITISDISYGSYPYYGTFSWSETKPANTYVTMRVRAGNTATPDGTWTAWTTVSNGGSLSAFSGNKYVQYEATLSSDDINVVPMVNDISLTYGGPWTLTSSPYNTTASNNTLNSITWSETKPGTSDVVFQVRTSADNSTWTSWMGPGGTSGSYFTDPAGGETMPAGLRDGANDQWIQYKMFLLSDLTNSPTVGQVQMNYNSLVPVISSFSVTPNTGNTTKIYDIPYVTETMTINGSDFVSGATVKLRRSGYTDADCAVTGLSSSQITCTFDNANTPSTSPPANWDIVVTNTNGASVTSAAAMESVRVIPAITSISANPNNGNPAQIDGTDVGNVILTINGSGFVGGATAKIVNTVSAAEVSLTGLNVVSASQITATLDSSATYGGIWSVVVTNINAATGTLTGGLTIINKSVSTSAVLDLTSGRDFSTITWADSTPSGTSVTLEIRAGNTATPDGGWTAYAAVTKGQDLGSSIDGNRYVQYRATLRSSNASNVPSFHDVTLSYVYYPTGSFQLLGSPYNAGASDNILANIQWSESVPSGTDVKFQTRTAPDNGSGAPNWASGSKWCGPTTCAATTGDTDYASSYYNSVPAGESANAVQRDGSSDQWMQYSLWLDTSNAGQTPVLSQVTLGYAVNAQPAVTNVTASQNSDGTISVGYDLADIDSSSFTVSASADLGITFTDNPLLVGAATINLAGNYAYLPTGSQTVIIESEQITCTSRSGAVLSSCTRGVNSTTASQHTQSGSTIVWAKAITATGNIGAGQTAGSGKAITWTIKTDFNGVYRNSSQGKIRVTANDGNIANQVGNGDSSTFVIDTLNPVPGTHPVLVDASTTSNNITTSATDNSTLSRRLGLDTTSPYTCTDPTWKTGFVSCGAANCNSPATLDLESNDPATVCAQFQDAYSNQTAVSYATTPETPTAMMIQDTSNLYTDPDELKLFVAWKEIAAPTPGFASYKVYKSLNQTTWNLINTQPDRTLNYYTDESVNLDENTYYKVKVTDTDGNVSYLSSQVFGKANGKQDAGEGGGGGNPGAFPTISEVAAGTPTSTTVTITWETDMLSDSVVQYMTQTGGDFEGNNALSKGKATLLDSDANLGDHSVTLTGLTPDTTYYFQVLSTTADGATTTEKLDPNGYSFTTGEGPAISNVSVDSETNEGATISWDTDVNATTFLSYSDQLDLSDAIKLGSDELVTDHEIEIGNLTSDTDYYFQIEATDANDATTTDDNGGSYYTFTTNDSTGPIISSIDEPIVTNGSAVIYFTTDEQAQVTVDYGTESGDYDEQETVISYDYSHYVILDNLEADTDYYYQITATDIAGNDTQSAEGDFETDPAPGQDHDPLDAIEDIEASVVTDTKAVVTFTTETAADEAVGGNCAIEYGTTTDLNEVPITEEDGIYNETHSMHLTGLISNTLYYYQVVCEDNLDPATVVTDDNDGAYYSFTTLEDAEAGVDETAPEITGVSTSAITGESVTVSWETDEKGNSFVKYGITKGTYEGYGGDSTVNEITDNYTTNHQVVINNLVPATKYYYKVVSYDAAGNFGESAEQTFTTAAASSLGSIKITSVKLGEAVITWRTSEKMTSAVEYGLTETYGDSKESTSLSTDHEVVITGLEQNTEYHLRVKGEDALNNLYSSGDYTFTPKSPPVISDAKTADSTEHEVIITFTTNTPTDSLITYQPISSEAKLLEEGGSLASAPQSGSQGSPTLTTSHELTLKNLTPGTTYSYTITVKDLDGNSASYPDQGLTLNSRLNLEKPTFTTGKDENPPKIDQVRTDSALAQNDKVQTIISWLTNEPADTKILYREGLNGEEKEVTVSANYTPNHIAVITSFKPGTAYYFKARSADLAGNTATSGDFALLTPKRKENIVQIIISNFQDIFSWARF